MIGVVLGTCWKDQIVLPSQVVQLERFHLYDGFTVDEVVTPMRAAAEMGCDTIILTNACGAVNPDLEIGEVVSISDHLNLTGTCPKVGFQTLADVWTPLPALRSGVFAQVRGPAFETPAEARMLRSMGADMVGMSTVLEAIAARYFAMRVIGLALVTDYAGSADGHDQVLAVGQSSQLTASLEWVLSELTVGA